MDQSWISYFGEICEIDALESDRSESELIQLLNYLQDLEEVNQYELTLFIWKKKIIPIWEGCYKK